MSNRILLLPVIGVTTFFVLLFLFTKFVGPIPFSVNSITTQKTDSFSVTGEGKSIVKPDTAVVTVGVQAEASTAKAAQEQINGVINKVSQAIKNLGIDEKDIQTTNYYVNPTIDYSGGPQRITGYTANTNLTIKVKEIEKVNQVIDVSTQNGANQVGGVSFDVYDKTEAENEAREKAVAQAKKKAEAAARIAGFNLGKIINYQESPLGPPGPVILEARGSLEDTKPTQVQPGSSEITIQVTLSFEVR